jgi:BirA family transcriptional regulator, biotin operon repressor / biotin---[acetyl-CoA-carboxylase] ligase
MAFELGPKARAAGYRLAQYETITSTSTEALAWASLGDPGRLWVVAKEQTAGHGRRGRPWQTPAGNLAATLLMVEHKRQPNAATLGFVAGLALEKAIRLTSPSVGVKLGLDGASNSAGRLALKWPNDVLFDGAKVAGILLEAVTVSDNQHSLVIGIGVNVRHAPQGVSYPTTSLFEQGSEMGPEELFTALAEAWVEQEAVWNNGRGFSAIRDLWLERAAGLGAPIAVKSGEDIFRGTFETIDDEGRLIVRALDGSSRAISAGDVHFGVAATALN